MRRATRLLYCGVLLAVLQLAAPVPGFTDSAGCQDGAGCRAEAAASPDETLPDETLPDKVLHGLAGASASFLAAAVTCACVARTEPGEAAGTVAAVSLASAAVIGLAKELLDLAGDGDPDLADFLWTLAGGLAVAAGAYGLVLDQAGAGDPARLSPPLATFAVLLAVPVADAWCRSARRAGATSRHGNPAPPVIP